MIDVAEVTHAVRRALDEFTVSGKAVTFDTGVEETASSNFSDEDLEDRAMDGARFIAARVTAASVKELVKTIDPTDKTKLFPVGADTATDLPLLRLLGSRVKYSGAKADRRTFSAHMSGEHLAATDASPVYIFEDGEFVLSVTAGDTSSEDGAPIGANATAEVVVLPVYVRDDGTTITGFDGHDFDPTDTQRNIPVDERFRSAIVAYVVSSCFMTLRHADLAADWRKVIADEIGPHMIPRFMASDKQNAEEAL